MVTGDALARARASFEREAWREAHACWSAADREDPLGPEDLDRLACCAYMLGNDAEYADLWSRAHHAFLERGDAEQAARCAFRVGFDLLSKGMLAHGSGWLARARRVLDDAGVDSVVRAYLIIPDAIRTARAGDATRAYDLFSQAVATGKRFGDNNLVVLSRMGQGRALIRMGRVAEGVALLDEVMVAVTAGEVATLYVGDVYCSVLDACAEIFDLARAHEWTEALTQWCDRQPDRVPY